MVEKKSFSILEGHENDVFYCSRASIKAVIDRLTQSAFLAAARGYPEKDRFLYVLLLAIEVKISYLPEVKISNFL